MTQEFYHELNSNEGNIFFNHLGITIGYKIEDSNKQFTKKDGIVHINYDIIKGNLFFRNRKASDSFVPLGGTGTKSVKKCLSIKKSKRK